ncbi:uncharacterized protein cep164 isoform X1 [Stigmatopora nigra]
MVQDSDISGAVREEERTEPEMQEISGGQSSEPPSQQDSLMACRLSPLAVGNHLNETGVKGRKAFEESEKTKKAKEKDEVDEKRKDKNVNNGDFKKQEGAHGTLENKLKEISGDEGEMKNKGDGGGINSLQEQEKSDSLSNKDDRPERIQPDEIFKRINMNLVVVKEKEDMQEKEKGSSHLSEDSEENDTNVKEIETDCVGDLGKINAYGDEEEEERQGGEEENDESHGDLERCSLSQRKLTDDEEEMVESCVASGTQWERNESKDESDGQKAQSLSLNEDTSDLSEMEREKQTLAKSQQRVLKMCEQKRESGKMESLNFISPIPAEMSDKVLELNILSSSVSPLGDNDERDGLEEEVEMCLKKESAMRHLQSPVEPNKIDRLVLHHSSVGNKQTAAGLSSALNPSRPETSRGRLSRISNTLINEAATLERESDFGILKNDQKEEDEYDLRKYEKQNHFKDRSRKENKKSGDAVQEVEESKEQRMDKNDRLYHMREAIMREEEEEKEFLKREKEKRISSLKEELKMEEEAEKDRLKLEMERRKCLLQEELRNKEQEEKKLTEESKEKLRNLKQHILSERQEEEVRLKKESDEILEALKESALKDREWQLRELREENETKLKELHSTFEGGKKAAERNNTQKRLEIERMKAESEEKLHLQKKKFEEDRAHLLNQEVMSTERRQSLIGVRPEQQLKQYRRELSDLLLEVREEVQRDHDKRLEQLREEHRRELNTIREKQREKESIQRDCLLSTHQRDIEHLQASHAFQLEKLQKELDSEIEKAVLTHSHRKSQLQDLITQLEMRGKELKKEEEMLFSKRAELNRKRKMLGEEEEDLDKQTEALHKMTQERECLRLELEKMKEERAQTRELLHLVREERNEARQEQEKLGDERENIREDCRKLKEDKERLERKVALLEEQCNQLNYKVSEMELNEEGITTRQKKGKNVMTSPLSGERDCSLHVDDLEDRLPSDGNGDILEFRGLNTSQSASIQKTKLFLEQESNRLPQRQTLHLTQVNSVQQSNLEGKSLLQGASILTGERKVTFDLTDSDLSSTVDTANETGNGIFLAKVQELAASQQQISGQLNTVLGALGSLAHKQCNNSHPAFSATLPHYSAAASASPTPGRAPLGQPDPPSTDRLGTSYPDNSVASGLNISEHVTQRRWREIFPEAAALNTNSLRKYTSHASYTPASLHVQKSVKLDGQRLQKLIDSNKKWLEMRKKDPSIPLFTRFQASSSQSNLVQLGLDDKDRIRVYHY